MKAQTGRNKYIRIGLLFSLITALLLSCFAQPATSFAKEADEKSFTISDRTYETVDQIEVPFFDSKDHLYKWTFPYTDDYFLNGSEIFDPELAKASIGLAVSAYRTLGVQSDNQYETYLDRAGFSEIHPFGYDQPTSKDTLSGVIAYKLIGDTILIAAAPCGQGYKNEWAGNLEVGNEERHAGFNHAAQIFEDEIHQYITEHNFVGDIKLWITGYSRAAAVANLTAADMIASEDFSDVYAYLFAVPRTTKAAKKYQGIYNILGAFDPITNFPLQTWGFERYGTDIYTPAQETHSDFPILSVKATQVSANLTGKPFRNNPLVNYQLHLMIEFLAELFPKNEEYVEKMQDTVMRLWTDPNDDNMFNILISVLQQMDKLDSEEQDASKVFISYLELIMAEHLRGDFEENHANWDSDLSITLNYMAEHLPHTYIGWVFSDTDSSDLYKLEADTRRIVLTGDFTVDVYRDGEFISGINEEGKLTHSNYENGNVQDPEIYIQKSGKEYIVSLPMDDAYEVRINKEKSGSIVYYQIENRADSLRGFGNRSEVVFVKPGIYTLKSNSYLTEDTLDVLKGDITNRFTSEYTYSPTVLMLSETNNSLHVTVGMVLSFVLAIVIFLVILGIVNLIVFIVHLSRKRKRTRPYSNWWVIIPHLLMIFVAMAMTLFLTYNFYLVPVIRTAVATLTCALILILAVRALIRCFTATEEKGYRPQSMEKKIMAAVYLTLLAVITALAWVSYSEGFFATYSDEKALFFIAAVTAGCVIAILFFPWREKKRKRGDIAKEQETEDVELEKTAEDAPEEPFDAMEAESSG